MRARTASPACPQLGLGPSPCMVWELSLGKDEPGVSHHPRSFSEPEPQGPLMQQATPLGATRPRPSVGQQGTSYPPAPLHPPEHSPATCCCRLLCHLGWFDLSLCWLLPWLPLIWVPAPLQLGSASGVVPMPCSSIPRSQGTPGLLGMAWRLWILPQPCSKLREN